MPPVELPRPEVILLDIEGTICPISFVKDVLFPYALRTLPETAKTQWTSPDFQRYVSAFPDPATRASPSALCACVEQLTRDDVKVAYLKDLQGYLWRTGYESGAFSSPLFPDVVPALESWHSPPSTSNPSTSQSAPSNPPIRLAIYSSGSVAAQKLLLQYVNFPPTTTPTTTTPRRTPSQPPTQDLRPLFQNAYFDTTNAGSKLEPSSYSKIAQAMHVDAGRMLFFSDNVGEVEAARMAGMGAVVVRREGNKALSAGEEDRWRGRIVDGFGEVGFV